MSTQASDRRWWSVFTLVAIAIAAFIAILVCALLWLFWHPLAPVAPPTATYTATSTTAPAAPAQPVVPEATETPKAAAAPDVVQAPATKAPTATVYDFVAVLDTPVTPKDFVTVLDTPVTPKDFVTVLQTASDLQILAVGYTTNSLYLGVHVRNNGPADLVGKVIDAQCTGVAFLRGTNPPVPGPAVYGRGGGKALDVAAESAFEITVPISVVIDSALYYYPGIQCDLIFVGNFDPKLDNNLFVWVLP